MRVGWYFTFEFSKKVKVTLEQEWRPAEGAEVQLYSFFNIDDRRGWVVKATPRPVYPREGPGAHWMSPKAGLDGCAKSRQPPEFDPRTIQQVPGRYADYAIPAHVWDNLHYSTRMRLALFNGPIPLHPKTEADPTSYLF